MDKELLSQIGALQVPRLDIIQLQHRNLIDRCQLAYFIMHTKIYPIPILTDSSQRSSESTLVHNNKVAVLLTVVDLGKSLLLSSVGKLITYLAAERAEGLRNGKGASPDNA